MWDYLFKPMDTLQKNLAAGWLRNAVIRNNIANVETPNFKASDVEFESLLADALKTADEQTGFVGYRTHEKHIPIGDEKPAVDINSIQPLVYKRDELSMRMDGNNVDIEAENVKLAQNTILYNTLIEKLNSEIRRLRSAITEGR